MSRADKAMYPTDEMLNEWHSEWARAPHKQKGYGIAPGTFLTRKACDFQREKDAEICLAVLAEVEPMPDANFSDGCIECAEAIRGQQ